MTQVSNKALLSTQARSVNTTGNPAKLEPYVMYRAEVSTVEFGSIPKTQLVQIVASGRICGVLLEHEIAQIFGIQTGTQGESADLIDPELKNIQVKTYRSAGDALFKTGPRRGQRKASAPTIWTSKSGFWDRRNRLTPEELKEARDYIQKYQHFMYIDISQMFELKYRFFVLPSSDVESILKETFFVSEDDLLSKITRTVDL